MRVAASLSGERFEKNEIDAATGRSSGAIAQSLNRLITENLLYRDDHGVYAYTAPLFGDFARPLRANVDNRLQRVYQKLGISRRSQLADLLANSP